MNTAHNAPAFQLYPRDELSDLFGTTAAARGVFTTLRAKHWLDRSLPRSPRALAALAGVTPDLFRRVWPEISKLFLARRGRYVLPKLLELQREYDAHAAERSTSGTAGAYKRWGKHIPKKPRSRWRVLLRLAHATITDGKLLEEYRGDDRSMFEEFKTRAKRANLWTDDDDRNWPRKAWDAAKHEQIKKLRASGNIRRVK